MITITFDTNSLKRLQDKFAKLQDGKIVQVALIVGGNTLKRIMAEYPPESHRPQPFKSDKSRRFFFWALKNGSIEVPYRRGISPRSEDMKHRWTVQPLSDSIVQVSNNASYAPLVHGWETQAEYHKVTGWRTDQQVITEDGEKIQQDIAAAYSTAIDHIWNG